MTDITCFDQSLIKRIKASSAGWRACWTTVDGKRVERDIHVYDCNIVNRIMYLTGKDKPVVHAIYDPENGIPSVIDPDTIHVWKEGDYTMILPVEGKVISGTILADHGTWFTLETPDGLRLDIPWSKVRECRY